MLTTDTEIKYLKGVGEKRAALLSKLGIFTAGDLLYYFPRAYEDQSKIVAIDEAVPDKTVCVRAVVCYPCTAYNIRRGMTIYKTKATDGKSVLDITFFNSKYSALSLEEGKEYIFIGKIKLVGRRREMSSPIFEAAETGERIRPIYSQTEGMNSKALEKLINTALGVTEVTDVLPDSLRDSYCLMPLFNALSNMHRPESEDLLSEARRRLVFEELFMLQLGLMRLKSKKRLTTACVMERDATADFIASLPFTLTGAQLRAINDCVADMKRSSPMNRLLQGDVGSGKTAVAAAIACNSCANGYQTALMVPTEVLAEQHYKTLSGFFKDTDITVALLTGSTPAAAKKKIKKQLADGSLDIVVGTHALIQKDVAFSSLGLVITDEQHRFGVEQRTALSKKGEYPHTLVMSATPIPRTLALIIYSDLDLSILDELPAGRQKISTYCIDSAKRERAYGYVKKHLLDGRQGYIVCPLVDDEDGEDNELVAAQQLRDELAEGFFKDFRVGLLHGKMKPDEKREVMESFSSGETQLLVSTTVIEVGIDVPNAVIMVIENAERFGLSQLHQLRGRIGRGKYASSCILISDAQGADATRRLKVLAETTDGFKIADEDLKLRGPGDFFGSRQHGLPDLRVADMMTDLEVLHETRQAATALLSRDPTLSSSEYSGLKKQINKMFSKATN